MSNLSGQSAGESRDSGDSDATKVTPDNAAPDDKLPPQAGGNLSMGEIAFRAFEKFSRKRKGYFICVDSKDPTRIVRRKINVTLDSSEARSFDATREISLVGLESVAALTVVGLARRGITIRANGADPSVKAAQKQKTDLSLEQLPTEQVPQSSEVASSTDQAAVSSTTESSSAVGGETVSVSAPSSKDDTTAPAENDSTAKPPRSAAIESDNSEATSGSQTGASSDTGSGTHVENFDFSTYNLNPAWPSFNRPTVTQMPPYTKEGPVPYADSDGNLLKGREALDVLCQQIRVMKERAKATRAVEIARRDNERRENEASKAAFDEWTAVVVGLPLPAAPQGASGAGPGSDATSETSKEEDNAKQEQAENARKEAEAEHARKEAEARERSCRVAEIQAADHEAGLQREAEIKANEDAQLEARRQETEARLKQQQQEMKEQGERERVNIDAAKSRRRQAAVKASATRLANKVKRAKEAAQAKADADAKKKADLEAAEQAKAAIGGSKRVETALQKLERVQQEMKARRTKITADARTFLEVAVPKADALRTSPTTSSDSDVIIVASSSCKTPSADSSMKLELNHWCVPAFTIDSDGEINFGEDENVAMIGCCEPPKTGQDESDLWSSIALLLAPHSFPNTFFSSGYPLPPQETKYPEVFVRTVFIDPKYRERYCNALLCTVFNTRRRVFHSTSLPPTIKMNEKTRSDLLSFMRALDFFDDFAWRKTLDPNEGSRKWDVDIPNMRFVQILKCGCVITGMQDSIDQGGVYPGTLIKVFIDHVGECVKCDVLHRREDDPTFYISYGMFREGTPSELQKVRERNLQFLAQLVVLCVSDKRVRALPVALDPMFFLSWIVDFTSIPDGFITEQIIPRVIDFGFNVKKLYEFVSKLGSTHDGSDEKIRMADLPDFRIKAILPYYHNLHAAPWDGDSNDFKIRLSDNSFVLAYGELNKQKLIPLIHHLLYEVRKDMFPINVTIQRVFEKAACTHEDIVAVLCANRWNLLTSARNDPIEPIERHSFGFENTKQVIFSQSETVLNPCVYGYLGSLLCRYPSDSSVYRSSFSIIQDEHTFSPDQDVNPLVQNFIHEAMAGISSFVSMFPNPKAELPDPISPSFEAIMDAEKLQWVLKTNMRPWDSEFRYRDRIAQLIPCLDRKVLNGIYDLKSKEDARRLLKKEIETLNMFLDCALHRHDPEATGLKFFDIKRLESADDPKMLVNDVQKFRDSIRDLIIDTHLAKLDEYRMKISIPANTTTASQLAESGYLMIPDDNYGCPVFGEGKRCPYCSGIRKCEKCEYRTQPCDECNQKKYEFDLSRFIRLVSGGAGCTRHNPLRMRATCKVKNSSILDGKCCGDGMFLGFKMATCRLRIEIYPNNCPVTISYGNKYFDRELMSRYTKHHLLVLYHLTGMGDYGGDI